MLSLAALALLAPPTAPQVFQRVQRAYDAVKTFEQDVVGVSGGAKGTAHIAFARPEKLRASGRTLFGTPYDLLADGKSAWVLNNGAWSAVQDPETGIATVTGISGTAATLVPALLLHTRWGAPAVDPTGATVRAATLGGRSLLRVAAKRGVTWIDPTTYFVVRTEAAVGAQKIVVDFAKPKVDAPIPAARFKR